MGEKVIHAFSMESKIMSKSDIAREALKNIPSLDKILSTSNNSNKVPSHLLKSKINHFLSNLRLEINQGKIPDDIPKYIHQNVEKIIFLNSIHSLRSVINGTGRGSSIPTELYRSGKNKTPGQILKIIKHP